MSLNGKVAIITGAGSGIGRATAVLLSQNGANVVLAGRNSKSLIETNFLIKKDRVRSLVVQANVSRSIDAKNLVDETIREFGRLDILVNDAGIEGHGKTAPDLSEDEWNAVIDTNLKGPFLCSKYAIPAMKKNGHGVITNVASNSGFVGGSAQPAYCASKAGVILLTKAMAIDHANDGIVVNCVCPGDVETPMLHRINDGRVPANASRLISPEEIAHAILFLVSDGSAMTTGSSLVIDNGATAGESPALLPSRKKQ